MDSPSQDDNGLGRRMGLARLAKTRSLSNSLSSLQKVEGTPDEKYDVNSPPVTHRLHEPSFDLYASPLRSLKKQSATVSLLPNKMNLSELSGQQPSDHKGRDTSLEGDAFSLPSGGHARAFCSDPDFIRKGRSTEKTSQCQYMETEVMGHCNRTSSLKSTSTEHLASEDHDQQESPLQACRSASLDELNKAVLSYGLPVLSPLDAKRKNYLFGGPSSLLGASELNRYFPARTISIFIATWNMNGKEPPVNLEAFLLPDEMDHLPDMFVVGTQESGGSRSEWEVRLQATIGPSHVLFTSAVFGVLHLTIFLRRDLLWFCSVPEEATYSVRPGIAYKTKGGMAIGFQFFGTRMLFINSHLTAHEEKQALRVQNFHNITRSLDLPRLLPHKHKHKDVTQHYDCVFWLGDLNFRLATNRDHVFENLKHPGPEAYQHLLQWDQLSHAQQKGEAFGEFKEGPINFAPTFKYDQGTDRYDTSSKQRIPSYTDRILFKSNRGAITCTSYTSCPFFRTSDHKPVMGAFHCQIRPGKDDVPLAAGFFNRDVYIEALRRRRHHLYQPVWRNCPVQ